VHRSLGKYDPVYPFTSWIYRVGTNLCIDFIRKKKLDTVSLDAPISVGDSETVTREVADDAPDPGLETERSERARMVGRALSRLPENHRMMLVLRHQRELSYDEISLILDVPLGTVKARIHRARAAFRKILEEDCDLEEFMP
jgi:RNA polymerase sigma-70 factor (ECF subfamily)